MLIGTRFTLSPEQCLGDPLDARSDVYSIGAIYTRCWAALLRLQALHHGGGCEAP
jgi:serine/threonine protein kinase